MAVGTNVTVIGAGGSTVTIPFTSSANAAAAQAALNVINQAAAGGLIGQVNYDGSASIPSPGSLGKFGVGMVAGGTVSGVTAVPFGTADIVDTSSGNVTVVGPTNKVVVASGGGLTFLNQAQGADVYFTNSTNGGFNMYLGAAGATGTVNIDQGTTAIVWDYQAGGSTTVNAYGNAFLARGVGLSSGGALQVVAQAGSEQIAQVNNAAVASSAATITGVAGANITYYGGANTSAFINPSTGNVVINTAASILGGHGGGTATLFGGSAVFGSTSVNGSAFTGSATVFSGRGFFQGGTAGNNNMSTDTVAGATTLVGSGSGDQLFNFASKNLLIAGAGSETLVGTTSTAVGGALFQTGGGNATVIGDAAGGNSFFLGNGISLVTGSNGTAGDPGVHSAANYYSTIASGGFDIITDFVSGFDQFSLTHSAGAPTISSLQYYNASDSSNPFKGIAGTQVILSDKTTIDFFNSNVTKADFT